LCGVFSPVRRSARSGRSIRQRSENATERAAATGIQEPTPVTLLSALLRSFFADFVGRSVSKYVSAELAYVVQLEHLEAKVGGREEITPYSLRSTMIFRLEDGEWKVAHRHADPITTAQPAESVIQE
jgi:hypothetical protein